MRLTLTLLLSLFGLAWALTPAGTVIRNQAEARVGGDRFLSNVVETRVQALCVPSVTPDGTIPSPGQEAQAPAGGFAYLAYRVANLGNAPFTLSLNLEGQDAGFSPALLRLFLDLNQNGQPDPGEPTVTTLELAPGEAQRVGVEVRLPGGASGAYYLNLKASCQDGQG